MSYSPKQSCYTLKNDYFSYPDKNILPSYIIFSLWDLPNFQLIAPAAGAVAILLHLPRGLLHFSVQFGGGRWGRVSSTHRGRSSGSGVHNVQVGIFSAAPGPFLVFGIITGHAIASTTSRYNRQGGQGVVSWTSVWDEDDMWTCVPPIECVRYCRSRTEKKLYIKENVS